MFEKMNFLYLKSNSILIAINFLFTFYLLKENSKNRALIKDLLNYIQKFKFEKYFTGIDKINKKTVHNGIDGDLVGLKYPEILFDKIKDDFISGKIFTSFCNFLGQLETKLIYLEKEINVTKINAFYTARTIYLKKKMFIMMIQILRNFIVL